MMKRLSVTPESPPCPRNFKRYVAITRTIHIRCLWYGTIPYMYNTSLPKLTQFCKEKPTMLPNHSLHNNAAANNLCSHQQQSINNAFAVVFVVAEAAAVPPNPPAPVPCL